MAAVISVRQSVDIGHNAAQESAFEARTGALGRLEVRKHHTLRVRQSPIDRTLEAGNVDAQRIRRPLGQRNRSSSRENRQRDGVGEESHAIYPGGGQ